ncbi:MAG: AbrB/MazE/SpoVT family DNA-binding domain-containing protein, partial [Terriglobales bacterium]
MNTTLTIDKAGRIVLPKPVREALQISPGDSLELESSEDQILLRPARGRA